jgi:hypothetical protein
MKYKQLIPGSSKTQLTTQLKFTRFRNLALIAYASEKKVLILSSQLVVLQTLLVSDDNDRLKDSCRINALDWCKVSGRLAVAVGCRVLVYEPSSGHSCHEDAKSNEKRRFSDTVNEFSSDVLKWQLRYEVVERHPIQTLSWHPSGRFLLVAGMDMSLWDFKSIAGAASRAARLPQHRWTVPSHSPIRQICFSPCGRFFATISQHNRCVKVWFHRVRRGLNFVYLPHARSVLDLKWRPPHVHRSFTRNVLLTLSCDGCVRVWTETGPNERVNFTQSLVIDPAEGHGEALRTSGGILAVDWLLWPDLTFISDDRSQTSFILRPDLSSPSSSSSSSLSSSSSSSSESDDDERNDMNEGNHDDTNDTRSAKTSVQKSRSRKYAELTSHGVAALSSMHSSGSSTESHPQLCKWDPRVVLDSYTLLSPTQIGLPDCAHHSIPNLRYRHSNVALASKSVENQEWIVGLQSDGSVIIWKVKALAEHPKQSPHVSLWSSLRSGLGTRQGNAALIALGQLFSLQNNSCQPALVSLYTISQRGELMSWNVDLAHPTPVITLAHRCYGHKNSIKQVSAHPSLPYCGSLDESGCLLVWQVNDINMTDVAAVLHEVSILEQSEVFAWDPSDPLLYVAKQREGVIVYELAALGENAAAAPVMPLAAPTALHVLPHTPGHHFRHLLTLPARVLRRDALLSASTTDLTTWSSNPLSSLRSLFVSQPQNHTHLITVNADGLQLQCWLIAKPLKRSPAFAVTRMSEGSEGSAEPTPITLSATLLLTHTVPVAITCVATPYSGSVESVLDTLIREMVPCVLITGDAEGRVVLWSLLADAACTMWQLQPFCSFVAHSGPLCAVRCAYFGRIATACKSEMEVRIWQIEATAPHFTLECSISLRPSPSFVALTPPDQPTATPTSVLGTHLTVYNPEARASHGQRPPRADRQPDSGTEEYIVFDWLITLEGSQLLAVQNGERRFVITVLGTATRSHAFCPEWRIATFCEDFSGTPSAVCWTLNGVLVVAVAEDLYVFTKWLDSGDSASHAISLPLTTASTTSSSPNSLSYSPAPSSQSNFATFFQKCAALRSTLPVYHPKKLIQYLFTGQFDCLALVLKHLYTQLRRQTHKNNCPIVVSSPPLRSFLECSSGNPSVLAYSANATTLSTSTAEQLAFTTATNPTKTNKYDFLDEPPSSVFSRETNINASPSDSDNDDQSGSDNENDSDSDSSSDENEGKSVEIKERKQQSVLSTMTNPYTEPLDPSPDTTQPSLSGSVFTKDEASHLTELLAHIELGGISRKEQVELLAVVDLFSAGLLGSQAHSTSQMYTALGCSIRFQLQVKRHFYLNRGVISADSVHSGGGVSAESGLTSLDWCWALHSEDYATLARAVVPAEPTWKVVRELGVGFWCLHEPTLREIIERVARTHYLERKNAEDCALFYIALRKKNTLLNLYKAAKDTTLTTFLSNDFEQERWRTAAMKNAFVLLSKQRYGLAVAFFLLANKLEDAVAVCVKRLDDLQLALVVARLWEGEEGRVFRATLEQHVLPRVLQSDDRALQSLVFWLLRRYRDALHTLTFPTVPSTSYTFLSSSLSSTTIPPVSPSSSPQQTTLVSFHPGLLHFFRFLKRHRKIEGPNDDEISQLEDNLMRRTVYAYHHSGCSRLALQTLTTSTPTLSQSRHSDDHFSQLLFKMFIDRNLVLNCALQLLAQDIEDLRASGSGDCLTTLKEDLDVLKTHFGLDRSQLFLVLLRYCAERHYVREEYLLHLKVDHNALNGLRVLLRTARCITALVRTIMATFDFSHAHHYHHHTIQLASLAAELSQCAQQYKDEQAINSRSVSAAASVISPPVSDAPSPPAALTSSSTLSSEAPTQTPPLVTSTSDVRPPSTPQGAIVSSEKTQNPPQNVSSLGKEEEKALVEIQAATQLGVFLAAWMRRDWRTLLELVVHHRDVAELSSMSSQLTLSPGASPSATVEENVSSSTSSASNTTANLLAGNVKARPPIISDAAVVNRFIEAFFRLLLLRLFTDQLNNFFLLTFRSTKNLTMMRTLTKWVAVLEQQLVDVPPDIIHHRLSQIPVLRSMTVTMNFDTFEPFFRQSPLFEHAECREIWQHLSQLKPVTTYVSTAEFLRHNAQLAWLQRCNVDIEVAEEAPSSSSAATSGQNIETAQNHHNTANLTKTRSENMHNDGDDGGVMSQKKRFAARHKFALPQYTLQFEEPVCVYKSKEQLLALCINSVNERNVAVATGKGIAELTITLPETLSDNSSDTLRGDSQNIQHSSLCRSDVECLTESTNSLTAKKRNLSSSALIPPSPSFATHTPPVGHRAERDSATVMCDLVGHTAHPAAWLESHPTLPYYMSGGVDGAILLWQFTVSQPISTYRPSGRPKITKIRFSWNGCKFAAGDAAGNLLLWRFDSQEESVTPYLEWQTHHKKVTDFAFLNSGSFFVTAGTTNSVGTVSFWDVLSPPGRSEVARILSEQALGIGKVTALCWIPHNNLVLLGGRKGAFRAIDIRTMRPLPPLITTNTLNTSSATMSLVSPSSSGSLLSLPGQSSAAPTSSSVSGANSGVSPSQNLKNLNTLTSPQRLLAIRSLCVWDKYVVSGSRSGSVSVWDISSFHLNNISPPTWDSNGPQLTMLPIITWNEVHKSIQITRTGVVTDGVRDMQISGRYLYTCGVDGRLFQRRMIRVHTEDK